MSMLADEADIVDLGLDWTPGSTTPQRWKHDGVHSLADALSPVLIQAVRDTPEVGGQ